MVPNVTKNMADLINIKQCIFIPYFAGLLGHLKGGWDSPNARYIRPFEMVLIYQPPNAHVQISWILLRICAMAAAAVKKI
jgi:hypothetical protein